MKTLNLGSGRSKRCTNKPLPSIQNIYSSTPRLLLEAIDPDIKRALPCFVGAAQPPRPHSFTPCQRLGQLRGVDLRGWDRPTTADRGPVPTAKKLEVGLFDFCMPKTESDAALNSFHSRMHSGGPFCL